MNEVGHRTWLRTAVMIGVIYTVAGVLTARQAGRAPSHDAVFAWRLSAFAISGGAFWIHLVTVERLKFQSTPKEAALHTGLAAAIGGFGLAVFANIHELLATSGYRPRMAIALVAWPLLTGVPAFFLSFVLGIVLGSERKVSQQ